MPKGNIFKCYNCGREVMSEEKDNHVCKSMKSYKVEGEIMYASDGERTYPLKWDQVRPTQHDREKYRNRMDKP